MVCRYYCVCMSKQISIKDYIKSFLIKLRLLLFIFLLTLWLRSSKKLKYNTFLWPKLFRMYKQTWKSFASCYCSFFHVHTSMFACCGQTYRIKLIERCNQSFIHANINWFQFNQTSLIVFSACNHFYYLASFLYGRRNTVHFCVLKIFL